MLNRPADGSGRPVAWVHRATYADTKEMWFVPPLVRSCKNCSGFVIRSDGATWESCCPPIALVWMENSLACNSFPQPFLLPALAVPPPCKLLLLCPGTRHSTGSTGQENHKLTMAQRLNPLVQFWRTVDLGRVLLELIYLQHTPEILLLIHFLSALWSC